MTTPAGGRGGYRQPERGAPVSGPGPLARRTDGPQGGQPVRVPTGGAYGEGTELAGLQGGAPLAESGGVDVGDLVGFGEPSGQPSTPVTDGAALGEGAGLEALGLPSAPDEDMKRLVEWLPALEQLGNVPGASRRTRNMIRSIKAHVPLDGFDG